VSALGWWLIAYFALDMLAAIAIVGRVVHYTRFTLFLTLLVNGAFITALLATNGAHL
jgi:hypothetical protein